jgi:hypothetical protein
MSVFATEFSQIMDVGELSENAVTQISMVPTGIYIDTQSKANKAMSLPVEIHAVSQAVCRDRREMAVLSDLYSNKYDLNVEMKEHTLPGANSFACLRDTVRDQVDTPSEVSGIQYAYSLIRAGKTVPIPSKPCCRFTEYATTSPARSTASPRILLRRRSRNGGQRHRSQM